MGDSTGAWRFTPPDGGARLAAACGQQNTLATLTPQHSAFTAIKLIHESAGSIRRLLSEGGKRSIIVAWPQRLQNLADEVRRLTDLTVALAVSYEDIEDWKYTMEFNEVLLVTSAVLHKTFDEDLIRMSNINVLVVDGCHTISKDVHLQAVLNYYYQLKDSKSKDTPRILALTYPLFIKDSIQHKVNAEVKPELKNSESKECIKNTEVVVEDVEECEAVSELSGNGQRSLINILDKPFELPKLKIVELNDDDVTPEKTDEAVVESSVDVSAEVAEDLNVCPIVCSPHDAVIAASEDTVIEDPIPRYQKLESQLESLETLLYCKADLAEDVDGVKRLGDKPRELIIECDKQIRGNLPDDYKQLESEIRSNVNVLMGFLLDHRFDLSEIYGEQEEFKSIPNPIVEPIQLLNQFLECLEHLGPYGADKAALCLLSKVEKLKVKVPYERHFLLLGLCTTLLTKIRRLTDLVLEGMDYREKLSTYCTPKLNRLLELLRQFAPKKADVSQKLLSNIEECNFKALEKRIGDKCMEFDRAEADVLTKVTDSRNGLKDRRKSGEMMQNFTKKRPFNTGWRGRGRGRDRSGANFNSQNPDALCGVIFVQKPLMAKVLFMLINEYSQWDPELSFVSVQYSAIDKPADPLSEPKDAEQQRKIQEEVLKRFRIHECNLLLATPMLEEGIDLPKCNLMLRWDAPSGYRSYTRCRARARAPRSIAAMMADVPPSLTRPDQTDPSEKLLRRLATYAEIDMMLQRKCGSGTRDEPRSDEELFADRFTSLIEAYSPSAVQGSSNHEKTSIKVNMSTAISLINRYCAKLPSDTFTRLVPHSTIETVTVNNVQLFICTLRLPINCPVKCNIVGHPMPTAVLARRMAALQASRILHISGELDNQLMPIGKENFSLIDIEWDNILNTPTLHSVLPSVQNQAPNDVVAGSTDAPRPGTTKRRQYYFKRMARALCDCRPTDDAEVLLYALDARLQCPLPERHNTRGRKLHAPEQASSSLAILTSKPINKIPGFPIYTRSGEVGIQVRSAGKYSSKEKNSHLGVKLDAKLSPQRITLIHSFMRYLFGDVLRVRRQGMPLDVRGVRRSGDYYIVPTVNEMDADGVSTTRIDWNFLELIHFVWQSTRKAVHPLPGGDGHTKIFVNPNIADGGAFTFDSEKYRDAVVTPWYRNHDQPQYFYVAEICNQLTPLSAFPQPSHESFSAYYLSKYSVEVTQLNQPLLDVDHTSARLNLLTPRYVSRKGVALPVSSERTRRAKRDRLDQKQILVPELCSVHPFSGALWRCAVALPCILYRINALLLADEIRRSVALEIGVGTPDLLQGKFSDFDWPPLDFGWCLADVLKDDKEKTEEAEVAKIENDEKKQSEDAVAILDSLAEGTDVAAEPMEVEDSEKTANEIIQEKEQQDGDVFEVGMWSNEIAEIAAKTAKIQLDIDTDRLPSNVTMCPPEIKDIGGWGDYEDSPPHSLKTRNAVDSSKKYMMADSDDSYVSSDFDTSFDSDMDSDIDSDVRIEVESGITQGAPSCGVRIEFKNRHEAEAIDIDSSAKAITNPETLAAARELNLRREEKESEELLKEFLQYFYGTDGDTNDEDINKKVDRFTAAVMEHEEQIRINGTLVSATQSLKTVLSQIRTSQHSSETLEGKMNPTSVDLNLSDIIKLFEDLFRSIPDLIDLKSRVGEKGRVDLVDLEANKLRILELVKETLPKESWKDLNCFSMDADASKHLPTAVEVGCISLEPGDVGDKPSSCEEYFDFDYQPNLFGHPGPSPSAILQALTMSNANDGINLERLETIGDSFLKYAITAYLYCVRPYVHEGKLSHMRSKQVSNLNLYRLGRAKRLGTVMIATKFEPHDNWLPPSHRAPKGTGGFPNQYYETNSTQEAVTERAWAKIYEDYDENCPQHGIEAIKRKTGVKSPQEGSVTLEPCSCRSEELLQEGNMEVDGDNPYFVPYNLITQHSIPDKSVADCVEALIGAYLIECGPRGALLFMSWLGIKVLPKYEVALNEDHPYVNRFANDEPPVMKLNVVRSPAIPEGVEDDMDSDLEEEWTESERNEGLDEEPLEEDWSWLGRIPGSLKPYKNAHGKWYQTVYGALVAPPSPLLRHIRDPDGELNRMLSGYEKLEATLKYRFRDRALMLQAMTHASHSHNRLTDCYQRLEFLGDAVLDYLITRYLYEDKRRHSPGALTDLRSALVNNTIFASLAVRHGFHKYFRHMSPGLNEVLARFVRIQEENGHSISEEHYLIQEDELEQAEDVEVPKSLGDLFESIAGAIYLDSGLSLTAVWGVYHSLMAPELEAFSVSVPKSPVRELLEAEPETAKFGKPERLADGRRVRVTVEVFGRGTFKGVGRNYRIAKCTAARCALRHLAKPVVAETTNRGRQYRT